MINFKRLLEKVELIEQADAAKEGIGHLPHVGELLYTGNANASLKHLSHGLKTLQGKNIGGGLSQKIDGKVSIYFGKKDGTPYVQYKGSGAIPLRSQEEIDQHIKDTGKTYLHATYTAGLKAAMHDRIDDNTTYQADVMLEHDDDHVKGNILHYLKPKPTTKAMFAVHTELDSQTGKRIRYLPDVSHLETDEAHFPNINMKNRMHKLEQKDANSIQKQMDAASELINHDDAVRVSREIAEHRHPSNQTGHRHLHFVQFSNKYQNGEVDSRDYDTLVKWTKSKIDSAKGNAEKDRIREHLDYIKKNKSGISKLLKAHTHIDAARDSIIDSLNRSRPDVKPVDTNEEGNPTGNINYNNSEGFVSELPGGAGVVKFVPRHFSVTNRRTSNARKVKPVSEEMTSGAVCGGGTPLTASGGDIAGMGYLLKDPWPDDVKISPKVQADYVAKNMVNASNMKTQGDNRRNMRKIFSLMNVGREAY